MSPVRTPLQAGLLAFLLIVPAWCAEPLPAALLEFMADFATEDGEWVDPVDLALMANAEDSQASELPDATTNEDDNHDK